MAFPGSETIRNERKVVGDHWLDVDRARGEELEAGGVGVAVAEHADHIQLLRDHRHHVLRVFQPATDVSTLVWP